jgi:hypothetical protein
MSAVSLDQVFRLAEQLSEAEREILIRRLQVTLPSKQRERVTAESLQAELERRHTAGLFDYVKSLRNKYAHPPLNLSDEELRASIHEFAKWEEDIDDLFADD